MSQHDWIDELIDFLLERLDAEEARVLEGHLPRRVWADWVNPKPNGSPGGLVWGCETCWQMPEEWRPWPEERWPCATVRTLALPFADDENYREIWHPDHRNLWLPYYRNRERPQQ